jgi:hypothetical protein
MAVVLALVLPQVTAAENKDPTLKFYTDQFGPNHLSVQRYKL